MLDLSPDYAVEAVVGRGGMGTVYRARTAAGAPVAIKVLDHAADDALARFSREARTLAALHHPAVVAYLDHGSRAGVHYLVTEWLEGETLAARLASDRLPIDQVLALARRVADALAAVHARGIVHRDLKPSNLFLVGGDPAQVKLLDFGIAFVDGGTAGNTRTGTLLGTPEYMAPEQARGERGVDARADVFSFGCVLYEALTAISPFRGDHMVGVLGKILFADPVPVDALAPEAPPALCELVTRMLAKDRRARPGDGASVREHLDAISASHAAVAGAPSGFAVTERKLVSIVVAAPRSAAGGGAPDDERSESNGVGARSASPAGRGQRPRGVDTGALPTVVDARPALARLRAAAASIDVAFEQLAEGAIMATIAGRGHAVDQAAAAARCALTMRAELGPGPIAAATGLGVMASAGPGGLGEVIDRAVSLLGDGDQILLDATTAGLLDGRFDVRATPELRLIGLADEVETTRRLLGKPAPFVGRALELGALESAYAAAAGDPGARAVVVTGAAGVGKSRLRHELIARLGPDVPVWIGRGDPTRAGDPLGILGQAMRRALGVHDGDAPSLVRARLDARIGRHFAGADRARVLVFLAEMIGAAADDDDHPMLVAARRDRRLGADQTRRAWLDWLGAETAERPLVLVLDDLQWGDATSIAHVDAALAALADRPLCVLALARPELYDVFPDLWRERTVDRIELGPLGARAAAQLVRDVLGDRADGALVERVVAQAAGNAFFLEELVRAVMRGPGAAKVLPSTVIATVHARVDALPALERRALRAASVFGGAAWPGGVAAVLGDAGAPDALAQLAAGELLTRRVDSRFPGEPEYTFRHELVRQAAYDGLTADDRALGHRRAAEWLGGAGDRDAMEIAEHWDRSDDRLPAASWFLRAARAALAQHDLAAASARAVRGLAIGGSSDDARTSLLLVQAEAEAWAGHAAAAAAAANAALDAISADDPQLLHALDLAIRAAGRTGAYDRVEALAARAAAIEATGRERGTQAAALAGAAGQLLHAGRYQAARALGDRLDVLAEQELDPGALAEVHRARAARARANGDPWNDARGYADALAAYQAAGDLRNAASARVSLGFALAELGELDRAHDELARALADAEARGLAAIAARARHNLGLVHCERGELELAWTIEQAAVDELRAQGLARQEGGARVYLAMIALRRGDPAAALREADRACALFASVPPALAGGLAMRARALIAQGQVAPALAATAEATAIVDRLGAVEEYETMVRVARAEALDAAGCRADASRVIAAARARLDARAATIPDEAGRRRFLANDADNARVLELAAAWRV